ncbi:50S ribosomal protein L23 [Candidatus Marsarchaeota archaeon]|jgi:large subunit ribosomal protein L23|nr:50S ribosomal protein L23 [Candidatus Marsarchaeota archaeon]MCL5090175.1 50S ribosomal protein L23 [Candidatus Marsarchaeota archaeon]
MKALKYPLATEKSSGIIAIEKNNRLAYIVDSRATKTDIKKEFEETFKVKVKKINVINTPINQRKAYITLTSQYKASEIAMKLKLV